MNAHGIYEWFFAIIAFGINGNFIVRVCGNEDYRDLPHIRDNVPPSHAREEVSLNSLPQDKDLPKFGERLQNLTVPVGRDALLICVVDNLQTYKIAWLRVDTQTILTIQSHVITKNHRMVITHAEKRKWILKIRDVKEADMGWYMCQINTDPMKSQVAYLDVVVPPDILDYPTSTDMVVKENSNVTLQCAATGSPPPTITWRRETGEPLPLAGGFESASFNGSTFSLTRVDRLSMGAYLCIATNGIPPSVSKRVMLIVHFPPMISIQNQLVGAAIEQNITLECQSEAFPKSINFWMKNNSIIIPGDRYVPTTTEHAYKVIMKLTIVNVDIGDFGTYKCVAKNSLGDTDGGIKLYHIPHSTVSTTVATTTTAMSTTVMNHAAAAAAAAAGAAVEKTSVHKSTGDGFAIASNNVYGGVGAGVGSTSVVWTPELGRERVHEHQQRMRNTKTSGAVHQFRSTIRPSSPHDDSQNNNDGGNGGGGGGGGDSSQNPDASSSTTSSASVGWLAANCAACGQLMVIAVLCAATARMRQCWA